MANFFKVDNINMKIRHEIYHSPSSGFINSRNALKILLETEGIIDISDLKVDLALTNFRELNNYPEYFISLSHTPGLGAAVLAKRKDVKGLGIDIEWADREIKMGATKFFVNENDQSSLSLIELWTAKEAAFKALSPLNIFPGTLVLSKIIIKNDLFFTQELPEIIGKLSTCPQFLEKKKFIFSVAYINY